MVEIGSLKWSTERERLARARSELPVFANVQAEKGCSSKRDPALQGLSAQKKWLDGSLHFSGLSTHFL